MQIFILVPPPQKKVSPAESVRLGLHNWRTLLVTHITVSFSFQPFATTKTYTQYTATMNPPMTARVKISQNADITCQSISSALKSRTLSNLIHVRVVYIHRSK